MNPQDREAIEQYVVAALAPLGVRQTATEAAIQVQADAVGFVRDLVALLSDPKAAAKRLADIEAAAVKLGKAQAKLDADKAAHSEAVAKERAELGELRADVLRQRAKHAEELNELRQWLPTWRADEERKRLARARGESPDLSGSLTRDPGWRDRDGVEPDPHYPKTADGVFQSPQGT